MSAAHDSPTNKPTPQERLATSRRAIMNSMRRGHPEEPADDSQETWGDPTSTSGPRKQPGNSGFGPAFSEEPDASDKARPDGFGSAEVSGLWRTLRRTVKAWWRSHPAHLAVEVTEPLLGNYAKNHPFKLLGVAAAAGAVLVIARPWRLISVTGVLIAAMRSTHMSSLLASLLSPEPEGPRDRRS